MNGAPPPPTVTRGPATAGLDASRAIARRDLLEFVRDRRTLFVTLLLPMVTYPLVALSSALGVRTAVSDIEARNVPAPLVVAVSGPDSIPLAARIDAALSGAGGEPREGTLPSKVTFLHGEADEAIEAVEEGAADVWVGAPEGLVAALDGPGTVELIVRYPERRSVSRRAREQFDALIRALAEDSRARRVAAAGLGGDLLRPLRVVAIGGQTGPSAVATETILPSLSASILVLLSVLTMTGAFYPAIDAIAGEKERGTIETLLMAPCSTGHVVLGKFLAVWLVTLATLAANCLSIALTLAVGLRYLPAGAVSALPNVGAGACVTVVAFVGLAAIAAATCLAVTTASKSGKEAQNTLTPVILLVTALAGAALVPGPRGDGVAALVPFAGQVMLSRDVLAGQTDPVAAIPPLALSLLSAAVVTALLLRTTAWLLTDEDVLFRGPDAAAAGAFDRPPPRRLPSIGQAIAPVAVGLAGLWYVQGIAPADLLLAIPVHQALAVVLPLAVMLWWQAVDRRATLGLSLPGDSGATAAALAGAAILGAGTFLVSAAFLLALRGGEVSPEARELSERIVALVRERPWWVSAALVAILPAVAEELLFRGWALAGLVGESPTTARRAAAVAGQAALFAAAHVLPERMPSTFLLGLVAGVLRLSTGSILPPIVLHACHNAVPLVLVAFAGDAVEAGNGPAGDLVSGTGVPAGLLPLALGLVAAGAGLVALGRRAARAATLACWSAIFLLPAASAGAADPVRVGVANVGVTLAIVDGAPRGASVALWDDLVPRLGMETEYVVYPSIAAGLEAAEKGEIDLFLGPVPITREWESRIDFTHSILHSGLRIAVRRTEPESWLGPLDLLLTREVAWMIAGLAGLTALVGNLLWWFERGANERSFPRDWRRGAWEGTWWGISVLVTGGCDDKHVDTFAGRVLATAWMLVGISLVALFTGSLAATLTAERIGGAIHGPRDLAGRVVGTQASGAAPPAVRSRAGIAAEFVTLDEAFTAADRGEVDAVVAENNTLRHAISRPDRSDYRLVGPVFDTLDAGIALAPGSPLRERLNAAILALREDGAIDAIIDRYFGGKE